MGAEESKQYNSKHNKGKRDKYDREEYHNYAPRSYENQYANWNQPLKTESYDSYPKHNSRDKSYDYYDRDRSNRRYEKENRDRRRRHYSDDRSSGFKRSDDKSSHRERVRSDDRESSTKHRNKTEKRKKDSPRSASEKKSESKTRKEHKKRKSSQESKSASSERKHKSEKQGKASKSCLPNMSQQVKRRKKKGDLEKHKRAHRSAPDLNNEEMSRVGAWLNSNTFSLSPESPAWHPAMSYSYGTLPGAFHFPHPPDGAGKPRPIVDGMGSPLGTIYPDGTWVPNTSTASLERQGSVEPPVSIRYSMPPVYQLPYFPYYFPPHPAFEPAAIPGDSTNHRQKLKNKSRSYSHIDEIGNAEQAGAVYATVSKVKKKNQDRPLSSTLPRQSSKMRASASSDHLLKSSAHAQSGEFFSDIRETRESMFTYRANRQISVDNVRHANIRPVKTPSLSEAESDFSDDDSSSFTSESSTNDIDLDSNDVNTLSETTKSSSITGQPKPSNFHFFQPISKHEVFIDDIPESSKTKKLYRTKKSDVLSQPVVRLGEQESIVATSFLIEGEKAFCLTKSKHAFTRVTKTTKNEKLPKSRKAINGSTKPKMEKQQVVRTSSSDRGSSGTWYGLTGSPTPTKSNGKHSFNGSKSLETSRLSLASSSSSLSSRDPPVQNRFSTSRQTSKSSGNRSTILLSPKSPTSPLTWSPKSNLQSQKHLSPKKKSPTPKPRISLTSPTIEVTKLKDSVFEEAASRDVSVQTLDTTPKMESAKANHISDSSDSEPLMRDEDHDITRKLIRIDSRDSFTMKRRLKYHRRSSSLTDKVGVSKSDSLEKRSTLPLTPRSDSHVADLQDPYGSSLYSSSMLSSSPSNVNEPYVDALLHKAKSEEALKRAISRSSEELLSDLSPPRKKETLQERAARILGLSAGDLYRAKEKQDRQRELLFPDLEPSTNQTLVKETSNTNVTPSRAAQGNISHPAVQSSSISHRSNEEEPSGSFAVSVTESMLHKVQNQIEIKNVETLSASNSSVDISSISDDSSSSTEISNASVIPDAEFLIEVSDSVLEDASVPCSVKPHKEAASVLPKEYKLPDEIFVDSDLFASRFSSVLSPTTAQASIVARYTDNIYERVPLPGEISHASELSDDTTETESLDHSGRFVELVKQQAKDSTSAPGTLERTTGNPLLNKLSDFSSKSALTQRMSPVPVASHSAPLTPGEMDIIMQLYNHADDSVSSYDSPAPSKGTKTRSKFDLQKEAVANSIGLNVANLTNSSTSHPDAKDAKLGKVEDFEIKAFPSATSKQLPIQVEGLPSASTQQSSSLDANDEEEKESTTSDSSEFTDTDTTETKSSSAQSNHSDVEEVMQSLGLNPDEAWLVSL